MENMDKGLTVPKWVLINWLKIPQMPQNLSTQIVCPRPKVWDFDEKRLHWVSVARAVKERKYLSRHVKGKSIVIFHLWNALVQKLENSEIFFQLYFCQWPMAHYFLYQS